MTAGYQRGVFYWLLLLLLPTLAVGGGALWLLRREQVRLDQQARAGRESRRAAIEARARLIAENVELLVGDVQAGLMATLREVPAQNPDSFLDEWERTNPLVRATFRLAANQRVLRPATTTPWLEKTIALAPWGSPSAPGLKETALEQQQRGDIGQNVSQALSIRSALNDLATNNLPMKKTAEATAAREGWTPWREGSQLHLLGWRKTDAGETLGVEVQLAGFAARLGDLLPTDGDFANAFVLRDAAGTVLQSKVYASASVFRSSTEPESTVKIPLDANVLAGWEVVGFLDETTTMRGAGGGFFVIGTLLVGIFVIAILSGGSLLLVQARRSEAEAAQKTSFVANVSHEFKTPLTTIRLYSELLEQGRVRDAAQGGDYLRTIGRETQRLARLVNNALDFSRLEQGKKKYAREEIDLTAELSRLLDTHAPRFTEAGLALQREPPAGPLLLISDRDAIEQIVLNLLDNACKYAAEGGEITVALAALSGGGAIVKVADRGPGVPLEHRERIFEKFHRVDDALTAEKSGAGLGLSIARQLARGLRGELRYSPRAGAGAEFILELP